MIAPATASGADPAQSNLAGRQLGRYEVLTQLASGGMAAVYVARAQGLAGFERLVAIKVLHPHLAYEEEFISMFLDEARLAARIRHPNVVPTLDISDSEGDGYFLVMDYIEGDHVGALLGRAAKRGQRLASPVVLRVVVDALAGLGAAHVLNDENGEPLMLVHRDVSPHNVMVGTDGIGRITDFGVAKAEVRMASTRAGQFKGKLSYMAPEQASTGEADQRSDLFSMGIILWESLTGRRLFRGENNAVTLTKILQDPIPAPSSLWPELAPFDAVLMKALERDPAKRFQTADEFVEAIESAAPALEGIATARQVGAMVADLMGEKLAEEQRRVRTAIDQLGRSQIGEARMPLPRDGSMSSSNIAPLQRRDPTGTQSVSTEQPAPTTRGMPIWVFAVVGALIVAGGVLAMRYTASAPNDPPLASPGELEPSFAEGAPTSVGAASANSEGDNVPQATEPSGLEVTAAPNQASAGHDGDDDEGDEDRQGARAARAATGRERASRVVRARPTETSEMRPAAAETRPTPSESPAPTMRPEPGTQDLFLNPYRR